MSLCTPYTHGKVEGTPGFLDGCIRSYPEENIALTATAFNNTI